MSDGRERRRAPRKDTRFTVRNISHDGDGNGGHSEYCETRNISRNGAYCLSEKPFPEFARINITLELSETEDKNLEDLECEGVVVRADGAVNVNGKEMHAFALFFDRMSEEDRCKIDCFVEEHQSGEAEEEAAEEYVQGPVALAASVSPSTILLNGQPYFDGCARAHLALEVDGTFMQFHKFL